MFLQEEGVRTFAAVYRQIHTFLCAGCLEVTLPEYLAFAAAARLRIDKQCLSISFQIVSENSQSVIAAVEYRAIGISIIRLERRVCFLFVSRVPSLIAIILLDLG